MMVFKLVRIPLYHCCTPVFIQAVIRPWSLNLKFSDDGFYHKHQIFLSNQTWGIWPKKPNILSKLGSVPLVYFPGSCLTVHLDPLQCVCPVQGLATPQAFTSTASTGSCSTWVYPFRMSIFIILIRLMMTSEIGCDRGEIHKTTKH